MLKGRALSHREHRLACIYYQWDGLLHQFSGMARFDLNAEWVSRKLVSAQFNPTYEHTTLTDGVEEGHEEGAHGSVISLFFLFFFETATKGFIKDKHLVGSTERVQKRGMVQLSIPVMPHR